jgi:hypothetical protein
MAKPNKENIITEMGKNIKLSDLVPDDKNFNKGSEYGNGLIEKSFTKFGAGRSILIDKNNRIIAGNKSVENAMSIGLDDVQIVESDGKRIIAVKRMDIDLDTPQGREMALADNASAKANIVFDAELIEAELGEATAVEWGIEKTQDYSGKNKEIDTEFEDQKYNFKLEYTEHEYIVLKEKIQNTGKTPEQIFYEALI